MQKKTGSYGIQLFRIIRNTGLLLLATIVLTTFAYSADKPNILLVLSDDHSVPHLGAYGDSNCLKYGLTPNLDAFAREGMRFERAYTSAPQCAPSRSSIFTGRSPVGLSTTRFAHPVRPDTPFVTDLLRDHGYWVGLDGRHQHLDGRNKDAPHVTEALVELGVRGEVFESRFDHFVRAAKTKGAALPKVPGMFSAALDGVPDGKPFFLYFGFNQPHRKWGEDHAGIDPSDLKLPADWPDLPEVRLDYARYLAEVRELDTGFGMIMKVLAERGLSDNTLVVFMGDNGEALFARQGHALQPRAARAANRSMAGQGSAGIGKRFADQRGGPRPDHSQRRGYQTGQWHDGSRFHAGTFTATLRWPGAGLRGARLALRPDHTFGRLRPLPFRHNETPQLYLQRHT